MSSKAITFWVIVIAVVGIYFWVSNDESKESAESETPQAESKRDQVLRAFAEEYKTNTQTDSANLKYSLQLEDALITPGKPIVFTGNLDDIFREDGVMYMRFSPSWGDFLGPQIFYTLNKCEDKILEILTNKESLWGEYVVVANISDVEKPIARIVGSAYGEEVELELAESMTFVANGSCLDLVYIEDSLY